MDNVHPVDPLSEGEESESEESHDDVNDSDVELSEGDFENKEDDDLFAENVDKDITEIVKKSLGGTYTFDVVREGVNGHDGEFEVPFDEDLVEDSDEEGSVVGFDEEQDKYPTFNPATNFK